MSAQETADAINQRLLIVADSATMTLIKQSEALLDPANVDLAGFYPYNPALGPTYKEYNFYPGCTAAVNNTCPADYGTLNGRARFQGDFNGSMKHSSVYIYNTATGCAVKSDQNFSDTLQAYPMAATIVNQLAFLDIDFEVMNRLINSTVQMFVSSRLDISGVSGAAAGDYVAIHRSYPGLPKMTAYCLPATYDSTKRPWFKGALVDDIFIYSDRNPFTNGLTITFSSRKDLTNIQLVAAAAMNLDDIRPVLSNIKFLENGFAALVKTDTREVMLYGSQPANNGTYVDALARFKYLSEIDKNLNAIFIPGVSQVTVHTNSNGSVYYVAHVPLLNQKMTLLLYAL